jgi:hypothetical protein
MNDDRGRRIGVLEAALKALGKNVEEIYAQSDLNVDQSVGKLPMIKKSKFLNNHLCSGFFKFSNYWYKHLDRKLRIKVGHIPREDASHCE